jgi:UDP-GlcNAc:undecaprenyl-phosphate GlcNAc-1-phosphate transferase
MSGWTLTLAQATTPDVPPGVLDRIESVARDLDQVRARVEGLREVTGLASKPHVTRLDIFHGYIGVFFIAFIVALLATPLMRRLALANGIIDRPSEARKVHRVPVAYLGGVAVFLGILGGILYSYLGNVMPGLIEFHPSQYLGEEGSPAPVPLSVLLGLTIIMLVGLLDDVVGIQPRVKVGGQLIAAAALAADDVGVKVAAGFMGWLGQMVGFTQMVRHIEIPASIPLLGGHEITLDLVYWVGTAIIAIFIIGACNASNLIDGLDGLLSGVTGIAAAGLLVIALTLAMQDSGPRDAQRVVMCLALLGACLGFLPHNFNPASIFLGDCGSLLLGYFTIVIILTLGDQGQTHLVLAGLVIYSIPIMDTVLAIIRRKLAGKSLSAADDQHLHHMLKRALGVKGAVLTLYGLGISFAVLGVAMSVIRARVVYAIIVIIASFIVVTAIKIARRKQLEEQAIRFAAGIARDPSLSAHPPLNPAPPPPVAPAHQPGSV